MKDGMTYGDKEIYIWGETKVWAERATQIAKYLPDNVSVLDVGGGFEHLRKFIKADTYRCIDCYKATKDTIIADLNKEYPELPEKFQYAVCQGVMEYMKSPFDFLMAMHQYARHMILTYRIAKQKNDEQKIKRNFMSFDQVEELLRVTGWEVLTWQYVEEKPGTQTEKLYYCVKK